VITVVNQLIEKALNKVGYGHNQPTISNLIDCFKDYVDAGTWSNIEMDDVEDLTIEEMCRALIKL
jgi:hypothetical protein